MEDELEWLRAAAPPTREPDELTVRRARGRLLDEIAAKLTGESADDELDILPIDRPETDPATSDRRTGSRIAVLGSIAAAGVLIAATALMLRAGEPGEPDLDEVGADAAPTDASSTDPKSEIEVAEPIPDAPLRPLLLSTDAALADGQTVMLSGGGFTRSRSAWIAQCVADDATTGLERCDLGTATHTTIGDDGTIDAEIHVRRYITVDAESVSCAVTDCEISVVMIGDTHKSGAAPILLGSAVESTARPTLTADVARSLVDGQELVVTATGFEPGRYRIIQCVIGVAERTPNCFERHRNEEPNLAELVVADLNREVSATIYADRLIRTSVGEVDCAAPTSGRCALIVTPVEARTVDADWLLASHPLHFDPALDPPAVGVGVDPASGFGDLERVTITISGARFPELLMCAEGRANRCVSLSTTHIGEGIQRGSRFTLEAELPRSFWAWDGHRHDCVDDGPCELRVRARGFPPDPLPLVFDPAATHADPIQPLIAPSGERRSGEIVTLVFAPIRSLIVQLCRGDTADREFLGQSCDPSTVEFFEQGVNGDGGFSTGPYLDDDGNVRVEIPVYRHLLLPDNEVHDCIEDGPCHLLVRSSATLRPYAPIPLEFDPAAPVLGDPTASVSDGIGLLDGQPVTVAVSDIAAAAYIDIQLCPQGVEPGFPCPSIERHLHDGRESRDYTVQVPRLTTHPTTGRVFDCVDPCVIRVSTGRSTVDVPITFDRRGEVRPAASLSIEEQGFEPGDLVTVTGTGYERMASGADPNNLETYVCVSDKADAESLFERTAGCGLPDEPLWQMQPVVASDGTFAAVLVVPESYARWATATDESCVDDVCWLVVATPSNVAGFAVASIPLVAPEGPESADPDG